MIDAGVKKVELDQLQREMMAAGLDVSNGLGMYQTMIFPYNVEGIPAEFIDPNLASSILNKHVPTRPLTDEELNVMYADAAATNPPDQAKINHILAQAHGLIPRDRVSI